MRDISEWILSHVKSTASNGRPAESPIFMSTVGIESGEKGIKEPDIQG